MVLDLIAAKSRALITSCSLQAVLILAKEPCQCRGWQPTRGTVSQPAARTAGLGRLWARQPASPCRPYRAVAVISISTILLEQQTASPSLPLGNIRNDFITKRVISGDFYRPCNNTQSITKISRFLPTDGDCTAK